LEEKAVSEAERQLVATMEPVPKVRVANEGLDENLKENRARRGKIRAMPEIGCL
jgi:hypothetical protein